MINHNIKDDKKQKQEDKHTILGKISVSFAEKILFRKAINSALLLRGFNLGGVKYSLKSGCTLKKKVNNTIK